MGAAIAIEVEFTAFAHGENAVELIQLKTLCAVDGNVVDGAKPLGVDVFRSEI